MSKKQEAAAPNVVGLQTKCTAEDCKKKPEVAGFCEEHFAWFKEGMLTKDGKKPTDFDKKFVGYMKRKSKKKVA